jgi:hypothetical protein
MSLTSQESWVNGSLADAADMLAKRATVTRRLVKMRKEAIDLSSVGGFLSDNPALRTALIGTGIGAGIGGLTSMVSPKEDRKPFRSMLTGALAGGGLGLGAHYLGKAIPGGGSGSKTFVHGGRTYELDSKALAANPAAMKELNELMSSQPGETVAGTIKGVTHGYAGKHPILASILGADVASQAVGTMGSMTELGGKRIDIRPDVLKRGWNKLLAGFKDGGIPDVDKGLVDLLTQTGRGGLNVPSVVNNPSAAKVLLEKAQKVLATGVPEAGMSKAKAEAIQQVMNKGHGAFRRGGLASLRDIWGSVAGGEVKPGPKLLKQLQAGTGAPGSTILGYSGKWPFTDKWLPRWLGGPKLGPKGGLPRGYKGMNLTATPEFAAKDLIANIGKGRFGTAGSQLASGAARGFKRMPNPFTVASRFGRIGPRLGLYAGLPALQYYMGGASAPAAREQRVLKLIRELSVK